MNMFQKTRKHLPIFALSAAVALTAAWMPRTSSAAEPTFEKAQSLVSPFDPTKAGGNGNGNGNGGGGNGGGGNGGGGNGGGGNGGGGGKPAGELAVDIQPNVWNTNYDHSSGTISAVIRGEGLGDIDLDSIVLVGTDDAEEGIPALRVMRQGKQIRAFFAKDEAIASLDTPAAGEVHEVTIEFTVGDDDTETSLTDQVRIVGSGDGNGGGDDELDLDLAIQADRWNVNWSRSNGTVSALIRGEGLADIDLDSIVLVGTDEDAEPLEALRASRNGNHIRVFFAKDDAFATLDTPKPGEEHEIIIRLSADGVDEEQELTDVIKVVGPKR